VTAEEQLSPARVHRRGSPVPYDFRRPTTLPREHVRRLEFAVETFSRQFATQLSTRLRATAQVLTERVEQKTYDEYVAGLPSPSVLVTFESAGLSGTGLVQLAPETALACIDRLLGGPGSATQTVRPLTEIEATLIRELVDRALAAFAYAFESIMPLEPRITGVQHDPQFVQALGASDLVLVAKLAITTASVSQPATLMLPLEAVAARLQPSGSGRAQTPEQRRTAAAAAEALGRAFDDVPVDVSAVFAPLRLRPSELLELGVGDVLRLPHGTEHPLSLVSAGVPVARGVAARRGSRLACLVVDPEENPR
jgi:flagellar motor switch protein FliM